MDTAQLLEALIELAGEVGLSVRSIGSALVGETAAPSSGVCRVRGETWVLLADSDPVERRVEVLAGALRSCAAEALEGRFLPPAVRACLEG